MFPRFFKIEESYYREIKLLFPSLIGLSIQFKKGLPWFIIRKFARAIAVPAIFSQHSSRIYLAQDIIQNINIQRIMVHELMHIFQYQVLGNRGFGFLRPGFILYVYYFFKHGYYAHPMEVSARALEEHWLICQTKGDYTLFHEALRQEEKRLLQEKMQIFQFQNLGFILAFFLTGLLQIVLFILSLPGQLIFLVSLIGVFQKRSNR